MEASRLGFASFFKTVDDGLVLPTDMFAHVSENGSGAFRAETVDGFCFRDDIASALVGDVHRDSFVGDEATESSDTTLGTDREHTTDNAAEHV